MGSVSSAQAHVRTAAEGELLERSEFAEALSDSIVLRALRRRAPGARLGRGGYRQDGAGAALLRRAPHRTRACCGGPATRSRRRGRWARSSTSREVREATRARACARARCRTPCSWRWCEELRARADDRRRRGRPLGRRGDARRHQAARAARATTLPALVIVTLPRRRSSTQHTRCASPSASSARRAASCSSGCLRSRARPSRCWPAPHGVDAEDLYPRPPAIRSSSPRCSRAATRPCPDRPRRSPRPGGRLGAGARGVLEVVAVVPPRVEMWLLDELVPDEPSATWTLPGRRRPAPSEAPRVRSATSSPASRSSSRSGRTGASRCTGRCCVRSAHRRGERRTQCVSPTTPTRPAMRPPALTRRGRRRARRVAGAHREAAAQYGRAVRYAAQLACRPSSPPCSSARRVECHVTNQIDEAVAAQERALACHANRRSSQRGRRALRACRRSCGAPAGSAEAEAQVAPQSACSQAPSGTRARDGLREPRQLHRGLRTIAEAAIAWATRASELAARPRRDGRSLINAR